jgi:hypothetical protein
MTRPHLIALALALAAAPLAAGLPTTAAAAPAQAPLTPVEQRFYATASRETHARYATEAAAEKAGYFRYTNEDESGAVSYINPAYADSPDAAHPSQLWYDVRGRLLGGDWTQTVASAPNGPTLFGLSPSRFAHIPLHVHYGVKHADGTIEYGLYVLASEFVAAGLDPLHPKRADLVTLKKVPTLAQVAFVVPVPNNWDAMMWVIANAAGQFADLNPAVKPSPAQGKVPSERQT